MKSFYRVATVVPEVTLASPMANAKALLAMFREAAEQGAGIAVAPALSLTGATCGDLFGRASLEAQTDEALAYLCAELPKEGIYIVGLPIRWNGDLFSCAAVLQKGKVLGYVPKVSLTQDEERHFTSANELPDGAEHNGIPLDPTLLFKAGEVKFGVEVSSNLWNVVAPADRFASARAHLVVTLASDPEIAGQGALRRELVKVQSGRLSCAYAYVTAGEGESTTDTVHSGHTLLATNGHLLAESQWTTGVTMMDFNPRWIETLQKNALRTLTHERLPTILCDALPHADGTKAGLDPMPFVPADDATCMARCKEIFRIQVAGLARRFTHTHSKRLVIGLSGGLDSTLALLVCAQMCQKLNLPPTTILGITMPGFGTSKRTRSNVDVLAEELGIELREISIVPQVELHFKDIGHDPAVQDVTYENAQARARTFILMDLANQEGALHVGTGDLSEIALGWSTYNGDHMSMYSVNGGVPKTLMRACVESVARESTPALAAALRDICATPVSPELLPGEQHTESLVGSYELHDFFLYYFVKYGCTRAELLELAQMLHKGNPEIERTLDIFCRRFVQQQFKRSACPDGPKVGTIGFSPRGDWQMPSDASFLL